MVHEVMAPTPLRRWPLLSARCGTDVAVKHENHTPVGAFKIRGGIVYMTRLRQRAPDTTGVCAATRGNHGQSIAFAAARVGIAATIVVPHGNSVEKNRAMVALGARLVEAGHDFQAAFEHARELAAAQGLHMLPSFHDDLVEGVASYALEMFDAAPELDTVYVPIGLGSGICGVIRARDALGLATRVVGVVAENAPAYALSLAEGRPISTNSADTMADGMACRVPVAAALEEIMAGAERIVTVGDDAIAAAMRHYFSDTHNIAEGAGAAPLAALLQDGPAVAGASAGLILSGGNVDRDVYAAILAAA
ncbi:MAG: threonine dehydratase [Proteobacteria bacterium]|nr:threonine dehydratase [Pseudomonadota bacterium]